MRTFFTTSVRTIAVALVAALTVSACQRSDQNEPATADSPAMAPRADTTGGMAGMPGMGGMMGTAMMDSMHTHMQTMDTMSAGRMKEMLPMHRQVTENMLSQMSSEMRSMNMAANAGWTATADSLRQDMTRMPDLGAQELKAMMTAHHARMMRLMQMHRDMMGRKKS